MKYVAIAAVCLSITACGTQSVNQFQQAQYIANPHTRPGYIPPQANVVGGNATQINLGGKFNCQSGLVNGKYVQMCQ
jgi:hypothetical protein